jgi:predicted ribosome quality control (RQC) complex YloA/Tae2 family protein
MGQAGASPLGPLGSLPRGYLTELRAAEAAYRMAGSHVDITERKRAEEERERLLARERDARAEAEAAVRVLEEARQALQRSEQQYHSR